MSTIPYRKIDRSAHKVVTFNGHTISIVSAPSLDKRIDISEILRDPSDFHGPRDVDHIVNFGSSMKDLIGAFDIPADFYAQDDITVLAQTNENAKEIVALINDLAQQLIVTPNLYDDRAFCARYYELAKQGYALLPTPAAGLVPVSLIRAGLVTTRLALGAKVNDKVPNEIQVETKRAHPKDGDHEDLLVTVRWARPEDPAKLAGKDLLVADFVNPASWSSTAALLLVLKHCFDAAPKYVEHRSFMATAQGVALARRECAQLGIATSFNLVGITNMMNDNYYLTGNIAVADAGQALRHFRPADNMNDF